MSMINIKETRWNNIKNLKIKLSDGTDIQLKNYSIGQLNALSITDKSKIIKTLLDHCIDTPKGDITVNRKLSSFSFTGPSDISYFISFGPWPHAGKAKSTIHIQGNIIYEDGSQESMSDKTLYWKYENENIWYKWTDATPILNKNIRFGVELNNVFSLPSSLSSNALIRYVSDVSGYTISGDSSNTITSVTFESRTKEGFQALIQGNIAIVTTSKEGKIYFKQEESSSENSRELNIQSHITSISGLNFLPFNYVAVTGDSHYSYLWDDGNRLIDMIENQSSYIQNSISFVKESEEVKANFTENLTSNSNVIIYKEFLNKIASNYKIPNYRINGDDRHKIIRFNDNQDTLDKTKEESLKGQFLDGEVGKNNDFNAKYWGAMPQVYPEIVYSDWESINANSNDVKLDWSILSDDRRSLKVGESKEYIVDKNDIVLVMERYCLKTTNHFIPSKNDMFWYPQKEYTHQLTNESSSCKIKGNLLFLLLPKNKSLTRVPLSDVYNQVLEQLSPSSILTSSLYKMKNDDFDMYFKHVSDHASDLKADRGKSYFSIGEYGDFSEEGWKQHCNMRLACSVEYPVLQTSLKNSGNSIDYGAQQTGQTRDSGDVHAYLSSDFYGKLYANFSSYPGIFPSKIGFFGEFEYSRYLAEGTRNTYFAYSFSMVDNVPTYRSTRYYNSQKYPGLELQMYFQNKASQNGYVVVIWRNGQLVLDVEKNQTK